MSIFYKIIVYVYVLLTHKSVEAVNLSLNYKCVSKILYYILFCIYLYSYGRVNCVLMYGFALESILKGI